LNRIGDAPSWTCPSEKENELKKDDGGKGVILKPRFETKLILSFTPLKIEKNRLFDCKLLSFN